MSCLPGQTEDMQFPGFTIQHLLKRWVTDPSSESPESFLKHRPQAPPRPTESEPQEVTTGPWIFNLFLVMPPQSEGQESPPAMAIFLACPGIGWFWSPYSPGFHRRAQFSTVISTQPKGISACIVTYSVYQVWYLWPPQPHTQQTPGLECTFSGGMSCTSSQQTLVTHHEDPPLPRVPALPLAHHSWLVSSSLNAHNPPL